MEIEQPYFCFTILIMLFISLVQIALGTITNSYEKKQFLKYTLTTEMSFVIKFFSTFLQGIKVDNVRNIRYTSPLLLVIFFHMVDLKTAQTGFSIFSYIIQRFKHRFQGYPSPFKYSNSQSEFRRLMIGGYLRMEILVLCMTSILSVVFLGHVIDYIDMNILKNCYWEIKEDSTVIW